MSLQQSPEHQQAGSRTEGWVSRSAWLSLLMVFPSLPFSPSYLPLLRLLLSLCLLLRLGFSGMQNLAWGHKVLRAGSQVSL